MSDDVQRFRDEHTALADPAVVGALLHAARTVRGGTESRTVRAAAGYTVDVAVRVVPGDDRRRYAFGQVRRVAIRVDLKAAKVAGLPVDDRAVDDFLNLQTWGLQALFDGAKPVYDPARFVLRFDDVEQTGHIITKGQHRIALFVIARQDLREAT